MDINEIQQQLFQTIKRKLPSETPMAEELAKLLDISTDSAYRRMRSEKTITIDELYILCNHYRISIDQLMDIQTGSFQFQGNLVDSKNFRFDAYLNGIMHWMGYFSSFKTKEFYYLCKESPVFHHFYFKEFAAFKYFAWMGTLMFFPEFKNKKVDFAEYPDAFFQTGQKILESYNQLDSVEIWNVECLNTTLRQIDYYREGGMFKSDEDIVQLYEAIEKTMDHLEKQAELGYKFVHGDPERKPLGKLRMYFNEVVLGDNQMLAVVDTTKIVFLPHSAFNYIVTRDLAFGEHFYQYLQNLTRRSTLISEVSEKERARFFKVIRERIARRKEALKS